MPLYRADYIGTDGKVTGPVLRRDVGEGIDAGSDVLTRHMQTIRPVAASAARRAECDVLISRIVKADSIKAALVATPDGSFRKPDGMKVTDRGGEHKADGPCFCSSCRAERAEKRKRAIP
jgi:hypothetical protein